MIDIRTMLIVMALGNIVLSVMLASFAKSPDILQATRIWTYSKFLQGLAWAMLWMRGLIPDLWSIPVANSLLFAGFALEFAAIWEYLGMQLWRRILGPGLATAVAVFWLAYLAEASPSGRVALASVISAPFFGLATWGLVANWSQATPLRRLVAGTSAAVTLAIFARGVVAWIGPEMHLTSNLTIQAMTFIPIYFIMISNGFGFLLLAKEKTDGQLLRLATLDSLTEIFNRRSFLEEARAALALSRRTGGDLSLLMIDLDRFKDVNDRHGHQAGDEVLRAFARCCRGQLRASDVMGRLGGEEFGVILPATGLVGAAQLGERIRQAIMALVVKSSGKSIGFTVSVGVAAAEEYDTLDTLIGRSDKALYMAKGKGRNCVVSIATGPDSAPRPQEKAAAQAGY